MTRPWSGQPCHYDGDHYQVHGAHFLPSPVQSPRIPIWVADVWPHIHPLRRAARFEGVVPMAEDRPLSPNEIRQVVSTIRAYREGAQSFDVAFGFPGLEGSQLVGLLPAYPEAGVTWWLECSSWNQPLAKFRERIHEGPPHV